MRNFKWVVSAVALGMMVLAALWLQDFKGRRLLGPAGVKVGRVAIYDEKNNLAATQSVVMPTNVLGYQSRPLPITTQELQALPKDTTFGRRQYWSEDGRFAVAVSVVLMGTDHTSIHQPQYCLYAQDWNIRQTDQIRLRMDRPFAYDIPACKLTATQRLRKTGQTIDGIYVYWFVSGNKITSDEGSRLWSMWKTILQKGQMERWAYISYLVACLPGQEQEQFERLERFIEASAPEFQLVAGDSHHPMAVQK